MISLLFFSCVLSANQAPKPVAAIVLSFSGAPTRSEGKTMRPLAAYDRLRVDDTIAAGPKGSVTIYFQDDGHKEVLHEGASIVIGQKGGTPTGKVDTIEMKLQIANQEALRDAIGVGKIGGSVNRSNLVIKAAIAPVDGAIVVTDQPTFRWPAVDNATRYRVALLTAGGGKPVWAKECTGTELKYPMDVKALARALKYQWAVTAIFTNGDEKTHLKDQSFTVGTERMVKQAEAWKELSRSPDAADKMIAAVGFEQLGMLDELYPLYAEIAKSANDPKLFVIYSAYAAKAGLKKESEAAWKKALDLGWKEELP